MRILARSLLLVLLATPGSAVAQDVDAGGIRGRVEDAESRATIQGVRIATADSSLFAITDSLGGFTLPVSGAGPWVLLLDRFGYVSQRFELPAAGARFVLLLEPEPIAIEALTVEAEAALGQLVRNLESRRNAYPHAMRALDRTWLDRFGPRGGSALDILRQAVPQIFECNGTPTELCVRGRFVTFRNPWAEDRILVCIDGLQSVSSANDLFSISSESVALMEIYQRRQVRVYTQNHLINRARRGWTAVEPVDLPIAGCG